MNLKDEIEELGIKPVEGQNFLVSEAVIKALVKSGELEDQKVLEIGGGTGAITEELSKKAEKVYCMENDTKLARHLKNKFKEGNVEVKEADVLESEWPEVDRCVSNIPFHISSKILKKLGEKQIQSSLILQEELADKIVAEPGDSSYGRFTVEINYFFIPVKLRTVGKESYYPPPEVDTAILKLYPNKQRHEIKDEKLFFEVVRALFTNKRKKVRNAFVDARHILEIQKDKAKEVRDDLPHSEARVTELSPRELGEISDFLSNTRNIKKEK